MFKCEPPPAFAQVMKEVEGKGYSYFEMSGQWNFIPDNPKQDPLIWITIDGEIHREKGEKMNP